MSFSPANIHTPAMQETMQADALDIGAILSRGRIVTGLQASSKKKLLEEIANIFAELLQETDAGEIFSTLIERENLGSTGIGEGVALPHGRMKGLDEVVGLFLSLKDPLDYDAADQQQVNLIFAILVPDEATEEHLHLLARLAGIFRNDAKRQQLLDATDSSQIHDIFSLPPDEPFTES